MPVKIRLQRQGKKGKPYFHIVVADARAPRDGKYIERLGFYNPNTDPATIEVDVDGAVKWLDNGAQPTDTARAILGYKGVLYKNHLAKGVKKGAFDEAEAEKRFETWMKEKQEKIESKVSGLASAETKAAADRLKAETEKNQARAAAIAAANAPEPVAEETPEATETPEVAQAPEATETPEQTQTAETVADTPSEKAKAIIGKDPEVTVEEAAQTVAKAEEEVEAKAEEPKKEVLAKDEPKAEAKEEALVKEEKVEEPKAEESKPEEPKAEAKEDKKSETKAEASVKEQKSEEHKAEANQDEAEETNKVDNKKEETPSEEEKK